MKKFWMWSRKLHRHSLFQHVTNTQVDPPLSRAGPSRHGGHHEDLSYT